MTTTATPPADVPAISDTFTDAAGRRWRCRVTLGVLESVRRETGIHLGRVMQDQNALTDLLFGDPERFGRLVWCLCEADAKAADVTPEDFYAHFDGSTLQAAGEAVLAGVADFFPRSKIGARIKADMGRLLADVDARGVAAMTRTADEMLARPSI